MLRRAALLATALTLSAPIAAWAQASLSVATPDGARALKQQIHDWLAVTLGPNVKLPADLPVRVTAEGDHYRVAVPFGDTPDAPAMTASARDRTQGRWAVDDIRLPSPAEFHFKLPPSMAASLPNGAMDGTIDYKMTIAQQAGTLLLDTTFATPTTSSSTIQGLDLVATGPTLRQSSHLDRGTSASVIQPTANGRADVLIESSLEGYRINSTTGPDTPPLRIGMERARVTLNADGISRERLVQLIQAIAQGAAAANVKKPATAGAAPGPAVTATVQPVPPAVLLEILADLATGIALDETIDNFTFAAGGMDGKMRLSKIGFASKGADGLLQARLDLGAEGLTLPDLGLGAMADLIPSKVTLRPVVSGVPAAALMNLAKATSAGGDPTPADINALFGRGGITAGLENLSVDVAGTGFTGAGSMLFTSPTEFGGTAQVTATNIDALQQRLAADAATAQAGPAIIFLKGVGRVVDNKMVWDIVYKNHRLIVNNQDLTALTGGPPADPAPQGEPKKPVPPPANGQPQLRRRQ